MQEQDNPTKTVSRDNIKGYGIITPVLLVMWLVFLSTQALLVANPQRLNLKQLHAAQHLWLATVTDETSGEVAIRKDWKSAGTVSQAKINELKRSVVKQGETYLLPVYQVDAQKYEVVPVQMKDKLFYPVYGWSSEVEQQLEKVLIEVRAASYPEQK